MLKVLEYVLLALGGWCAFAILIILFRSAWYAAFYGIYPWDDPRHETEVKDPKDPFDSSLN